MLFGEKYHRWIYLLGLFLMAASLSLAKFLIGTSFFIIGINWLVEGNFRAKFRLFNARRSILVLMGIFLLHFIGIFWSADPADAWHDIRIKLPLLILPFVIGTSEPLEKKIFERLLAVFTGCVLFSSVFTILVAHGIIPTKRIVHDLRDASILVPLIRLSLMIVLSIFLMCRWLVRTAKLWVKIFCALCILWFLWFLQYAQSLTGIFILISGGSILLLLMSFIYRRKKLAIGLVVTYIGIASTIFIMAQRVYRESFSVVPADFSQLDEYTKRGNKYDHWLNQPLVENNAEVMNNVCWKEVDSVWKTKSNVDLHTAKDEKGNFLSVTLLRYVTSKGLRKDADGIAGLTSAEITAIQKGMTNFKDATRSPLEKRLYQVCWEYYHYTHGANPSGNSVTMRLELAKTAWAVVKAHPWIGVGTNAQKKAFETYYAQKGTILEKEFRWMHTHDQFLSIAINLGIPALLYFLFALYYAPQSMKRWRSYLYLAFFIIFFLSMFDDDTLETNQGVTFFAFFNSLLLYGMPRQSAINAPKTETEEVD